MHRHEFVVNGRGLLGTDGGMGVAVGAASPTVPGFAIAVALLQGNIPRFSDRSIADCKLGSRCLQALAALGWAEDRLYRAVDFPLAP